MAKFTVLIIILILCLSSCDESKRADKEEHDSKENFDSEVHRDLTNASKSNFFAMPKLPDTIYFANEVIPLTDIDLRERYDRELVVNNFWHSNTFFYFKRANRWFPLLKEILREEGVPEDFVYLAVIESGLTQAVSPSNAKGFWQFLKGTAQDYGLIVNHQIDQRYNVELSTRAACKYLKNAKEKFGSWTLAAAAYNRGKGGVNSDLNSQQVDSFFDLHINEETSRYVFRILAIKQIMESPEEFGFYFTEEDLYPPIKTKSIKLSENITDVVTWSIEQGINYKILKRLNPWIISKSINLIQGKEIELLLPLDSEQLAPFKG